MFEALTERFAGIFTKLRGRGRLTEADVDLTLREVRLALLEADVNVGVVRSLLARIRERAVGIEVRESLTPAQQVIKIVHEELIETLGGEAASLASAPAPLKVLMVGLQGSGKTTSAAKLAFSLKKQGRRPLLVAADLRRPAAIEQLVQLGAEVDIPVFTGQRDKPSRVVKGALQEAGSHDAVVVDTGGRLQIDDALMSELARLHRQVDPHEVLLVIDAMTGQEAVAVAQGFAQRSDVTGFVLSKLDGDARGGAAISVREVTGRPIKFVGLGEGLGDWEVFHPDRMASRILGMGDVLTLIEKAEEAYDEAQATELATKLSSASFTLEDFLDQFQQVRKMGSMAQLLAMLPGAGSALGDVEISDRDVSRVEAIIRSMTPAERRNPKIINGSRRRRIAAGSGTTPQEVNRLLKQFAQAKKMMKSMSEGRGMPDFQAALGRKR